jgi:hypothetical protein
MQGEYHSLPQYALHALSLIFNKAVLADPDPESGFFHPPDPGSKRHSIPNPDQQPIVQVFKPQKMLLGVGNMIQIFIPDPDFFPFRIQGSKKHWMSDPEHCNTVQGE